jgi:hypothetical protein
LTKVFTKGVTKGVSNDFFTKGFVTLIALNALLIFVTVLLIEFSLFNAYPTSLD